jgi:putative ABC transport system ATP-binding protein
VLFTATGLARTVGDRELYSGVEFNLERGGCLVVRGPSGSGKSLFLRQLAGLDVETCGVVCLDGATIESIGAPMWRGSVSLVQQTPTVMLGSPLDTAEVLSKLKVNVERGWSSPEGIAAEMGITGSMWRQAWSLLSGGERQRCHLALAMAGGPDVLLLDEPTSALDSASVEGVERTIKRFTCVLVTHDDRQADRLATSTLVLA